jgi:ribosomal protein S18 acetylase RimI-like enzyme
MTDATELVEPADETDLAAMRTLLWRYIHDMRDIYAGTPMVAELDDAVWTRELQSLARKVGGPDGGMLLARTGNEACGCVCVRRVDATTAEMKRLYVVPALRGQRLAERLVRGIAGLSVARGFSRLVFDVGWRQTAALRAYRRMGCVEIAPYHAGSDWFLKHTIFFAVDPLTLASRGGLPSQEDSRP